jgi:hypothetical protein
VQSISDNDPNCEHSLKVSRALNDVTNCCKKLYKKKLHQNQQTTLDAFWSLDTELQGEVDSISTSPKHPFPWWVKFTLLKFYKCFSVPTITSDGGQKDF